MVLLSTLQVPFRVDAKGAACLDNQVLLEHPERLGNLETPDAPERLVHPALLQQLLVSLLLQQHANHALKDHLAQQDHLEPQETAASLEHLVAPVPTPHQELQAPKDHPDQPEKPAQMAQLEKPVLLLKADLLKLAKPDQPETLAHKDHLDPLDRPAKTDNLDLLGQRDRKDQGVPLEATVRQDHKDHPGHQGQVENVVSVPNIALWTVVFSSRMEPGDKLLALDFGHRYANGIDFMFGTAASFLQNVYDNPWLFCYYFYYCNRQSVTITNYV